jgi:hypothetical protein
MYDLIQTTEEIHYENYRTERLENRGGYVDEEALKKSKFEFDQQIKGEEESFRQRLAEKVQAEENRFRIWESKVRFNERKCRFPHYVLHVLLMRILLLQMCGLLLHVKLLRILLLRMLLSHVLLFRFLLYVFLSFMVLDETVA